MERAASFAARRRRALGAACVLVLLGCQRNRAETPYYPLDAGRTWTYSMRAEGLDVDEPAEIVVTVVGAEDLGGQRVTRQRIDVGGEDYFLFVGVDDRGVYRYATQAAGEPAPVLDAERDYYLTLPLTVGRSWRGEAGPSFVDLDARVAIESTVESTAETVRVAAGEFTGCVRIGTRGVTRIGAEGAPDGIMLSISETTWYAPGVGLVKSVVEEVVERDAEEQRVRVTTELESFRG